MQIRIASRIASVAVCLLLIACTENIPEVARELPDPTALGAQLMKKKCGECHGTPHPDTHTAKMWLAVLHRMQNRMTMRAHKPLTAEEFDLLLGYLKKYSAADKK